MVTKMKRTVCILVGIFLEAGYECQSFNWEHPGMETPKWEDSANGRTYATLGLSVKLDKK